MCRFLPSIVACIINAIYLRPHFRKFVVSVVLVFMVLLYRFVSLYTYDVCTCDLRNYIGIHVHRRLLDGSCNDS